MRHSTVWVYRFAREIGEVREKVSDSDSVWQRRPVRRCRSLLARRRPRISAIWNRWISCENCIRNELPFKVEHQRLVKDIMIVEARRDWILRAKTGWRARVEPQIGWWVGWVETPTGAVIFALNIDLPGRHEGCAETGNGDCPIDTPVDRSTSAETCTGFHGASHLCKPFPLRFVTG